MPSSASGKMNALFSANIIPHQAHAGGPRLLDRDGVRSPGGETDRLAASDPRCGRIRREAIDRGLVTGDSAVAPQLEVAGPALSQVPRGEARCAVEFGVANRPIRQADPDRGPRVRLAPHADAVDLDPCLLGRRLRRGAPVVGFERLDVAGWRPGVELLESVVDDELREAGGESPRLLALLRIVEIGPEIAQEAHRVILVPHMNDARRRQLRHAPADPCPIRHAFTVGAA